MHLHSYLTKMGCFSAEVVNQVANNTQWPTRNRKYFAKLLANHLKDGDVWPNNLESLIAFYERNLKTYRSIRELHASSLESKPDVDLLGNPIVFRFKNGFTVVKLEPGNLLYEKEHMSNCIDRYYTLMPSGEREIYALHDAKDRPHVHISFIGKQVGQIKGKGNRVPILPYSLLVNEWLYKIDAAGCLGAKDYHAMIASHPDLGTSANEKACVKLAALTDDRALQQALAKMPKVSIQLGLLSNPNLLSDIFMGMIFNLKPGAIAYALKHVAPNYSPLIRLALQLHRWTWWVPRRAKKKNPPV